MASAFSDKKGLIISYRGYMMSRQRRVRIPASKKITIAQAREQADECEQLARHLENSPSPRLIFVERALELGVIDQLQHEALGGYRSGAPAIVDRPEGIRLEDAANSHPSTQREKETDYKQHLRHMNYLTAFTQFSGIEWVSQLKLQTVLDWVKELKRRGLAFATRKHCLLYLRRASAMGASHGYPDPLSRITIDKNDKRRVIEVWELSELVRGAMILERDGKLAELATLALGGFCGLRPSEIYRAKVGDIDGGVMHIGRVKRKNMPSERSIPLPAIVNEWIEPLLVQRSEYALISAFERRRNVPTRRRSGVHLTDTRLPLLTRPGIVEATGRNLEIRHLRKSFKTWAKRARLPLADIEAFMGHMDSSESALNVSSYIATAVVDDLRPTAAQIDRIIREQIRVTDIG